MWWAAGLQACYSSSLSMRCNLGAVGCRFLDMLDVPALKCSPLYFQTVLRADCP